MDAENLVNELNERNASFKCANRRGVADKLKQLRQQGLLHLQVITDFDHTLSRAHTDDGEKCWSTHQVFDVETMRADNVLGTKIANLRDKYLPIEFDPNVPLETKRGHMVRWWTESHEHIANSGFTRRMLKNFVHRSNLRLRTGAQELVDLLERLDVPLVVFSAGIGDIIWIALHRFLQPYPSNVFLISNMMTFEDETDDARITGFADPLIHTFNKNSSVVDTTSMRRLQQRTNVLLMGDTIGDTHMDDGITHEGTALKIGFLNHRIDELLPSYLEAYDVVLVDDQSMRVPLQLLHFVAGLASPEDPAVDDQPALAAAIESNSAVLTAAKCQS